MKFIKDIFKIREEEQSDPLQTIGDQLLPRDKENIEVLVKQEVAVQELARQKQEELESQIIAIQKSTKVSIRVFAKAHNALRSKYQWYYRWHLNPFSSYIHWFALAGYTVAAVFMAFNLMFSNNIGAVLAASTQTWGTEVGWDGWTLDGTVKDDSGSLIIAPKELPTPDSQLPANNTATTTFTPVADEVVDWLSAASDEELNTLTIKKEFSTDNILFTPNIEDLADSKTLYIRLTFTSSDPSISPSLKSLTVNYSRLPLAPGNLSFEYDKSFLKNEQILKASAFTDPDNDLHQASQWQITKESGSYSSPLFDSGIVTDKNREALSSYSLPNPLGSGTYFMRVRYQDSVGAWGLWSKECGFTIQQQEKENPSIVDNITNKKTETKVDIKDNAQIPADPNELIDKRTETTKTIDNSSRLGAQAGQAGTNTLESYTGLIHYKEDYKDNSPTAWKDINPNHSIDYPEYVLFDAMPSTVKVFKDKIGYEIESRHTGDKYTVELESVDGSPKLSRSPYNVAGITYNGSNNSPDTSYGIRNTNQLVSWAQINTPNTPYDIPNTHKGIGYYLGLDDKAEAADSPQVTRDDANLKFEFEISENGVRLWKTITGPDAPKNFEWNITKTEGTKDTATDDLKFRENPEAFDISTDSSTPNSPTTPTPVKIETKKEFIALDAEPSTLNSKQKTESFLWTETAPSSDMKIDTDVTFNPDPHTETATVDGTVSDLGAATWAEAHDAIVGTASSDTSASDRVAFANTAIGGGAYSITRAIFLFNTADLPDDATISSATLSLYGSDKADLPGITPNVNIYNSALPFSNTSLNATDFDNPGTTAYSSAIAYNDWSTAGYDNFTLNASGLSAISKTGISYFSSRNANYDVANTPPAQAGMDSYLAAYMADETGTDKDPKLAVTYTEAPAGITISGTVYTAEDKSTNIGAAKTIGLSVNGGAKTTVETTAGGAFEFTNQTVAADDTITIFVDDETENANLYTQAVDDATDITGLELYTDKIVLTHETAGSMTNALLDVANNSADDDIFYTDGGTFNTSYELFIQSSKTYTPGNAVSAGDIDINGTFSPEANAISISGSWDATGGAFTSSGTVTFTSTVTGKTITSNSQSFNDLIFNGTGGEWTLQDAADVNGNLTITAGNFQGNGQTINLAGNWSNAGTFTHGNSTVIFDKTSGTQTLNSGGSTAAKTLGNITKDEAGTLQLVTSHLYLDGNVTIINGTVDSNTKNIYLKGNWSNAGAGSFTAGSAYVFFKKGSGTQTLDSGGTAAGKSFYYLISQLGSTIQLINNPVSVTHALIIQNAPNSYFDANGQNMTIGTLEVQGTNGGFPAANNSVLKLQGFETVTVTSMTTTSGTVQYYGRGVAENLTIRDFGATDYYNLEINDAHASKATFVLGADLTVKAALKITSGTLDVTASNYAINFGYYFGNYDTLNARAGTVTFTGAGSSTGYINGDNTFYNFDIDTNVIGAAVTMYMENGKTQTFNGTFTATGTAAKNITLRSNGVTWNINAANTSIQYVKVSYSNNTGSPICAAYSTDIGFNAGWTFSAGATCTPTVPSGVNINTESTTGFTVGWTDNSSDETGFKVYTAAGNSDCSLATYSGTPDFTTAADAVSQAIIDKTINTQYCAKVTAVNGFGDSDPVYASPKYTLVSVPSAPTVTLASATSLTIVINQNSNPSNTTYAIKSVYGATTKYIQADGTLGDAEAWQDYTTWGGASGIANTGLTQGTIYTYSVAARNGDSTATDYSGTAAMADGTYISAAGGNWSATTAWVGGVVPDTNSYVYTTASSGSVTVDTTANINSLDTTGYAGTITAGAQTINVSGNWKWVGGTFTANTSAITMKATSTGKTFTAGGQIYNNITFDGVGGGWTLQDGLTTGSTATVTVTNGTFNTGNQTLNIGKFNASNTNVKTITLGASNITITGAGDGAWNLQSVTNLTFNPGTSTITITGADVRAYPGSQTYNNVVFAGSGLTRLWGGPSTFANLTITGSAVKTDSFYEQTSAPTVTGTLMISGNSSTNRLLVYSPTLGASNAYTAANVALSNVDFRDITFAGAMAGTAASTSIGDCGGNSGVNWNTAAFPTAADTETWDGTANNWSSAHWTGGSVSRVPLPQDTVVLAGTNTVTADMPRLGKDISFTGATPLTLSVAVTSYGSLNFTNAGTFTAGANIWNFESQARAGTQTLTNNSKTFYRIYVYAVGATLQLQDALNASNWFNVFNGIFDANTSDVTASYFASNNSNTRSILMGTGTWTIGSGSTSAWNILDPTGLTFDSGTSTIVMTQYNFYGGGLPYYNFRASGNITIKQSNTFNNFLIDAGKTVTFTSGTTQTINGTFTANGTVGNLITINSSSAGSAAILSKASGTVVADYLSLTDSTAATTDDAVWYAGNNSASVSNNSGWIFTKSPSSITLDTPQADGLTAHWTDNSSDETQFNVYVADGNVDCSAATYGETPDFTADAGATSKAITGLGVNTQHCVKLTATGPTGESLPAYSTLAKYTAANIPGLGVNAEYSDADLYHLDTTIADNLNPEGTQYYLQYSLDDSLYGDPSGMAWQTSNDYIFKTNSSGGALLPNTQYWLKVKAKNGDGVSTDYSTGSPDVTPPPAPTNLTTSNICSTTALASWTASTGADTYTFSYGEDTAGIDHGETAGIATTSKNMTGLSDNTTYYWKAKSTSTANGTGPYSAPVTFDTLACEAPLAPSDFAGTAVSTSQINWSWSDTGDTETGWRVKDGSGANLSGDLAANTTGWNETPLSVNTVYTRHAYPYNLTGGNDSNQDTVYTLANVPDAPTVSAVSSSRLKIVVNKNGNPEATTRYAIYNETLGSYIKHADHTAQADPDWQLYAQWGGTDGFIEYNLTKNTAYTYKVKAENGDLIATDLGAPGSATTQNSFTITIGTDGNGSGTLDQATQVIDAGNDLDITATPAISSDFASFSGCDSVSDTTCSLTDIDADKTITATFTLKTYTVTVNTGGNGSGTLDQATQVVNYGDNLVTTATPAVSSNFTAWVGCSSVAGNICTLTNIIQNHTITASFILKIFTVTIAKTGSGDGTFDQTTQAANYGSDLSVTATPNDASYFASWSGCDSAVGAVCLLSNIAADRSITATFVLIPTGTILINDDATKTNTTSVNLAFSTNTGTQMKISNLADLSDASFEAFASTKSWTLASGDDGIRTVYIEFEDTNSYQSQIYSDSITLDTTPTSAPTNLVATPGNTTISLAWTLPVDSDLARVAIFRSTTADFTPDLATNKIGNTTLSSEATYVDNTVSNNTTYYYQIKAIDDADNYSVASNQSFAKPDSDLPTTPGLPTLTEKSNTKDLIEYINKRSVTFSWPASSDPNSGLKSYLLSIGTTSAGSDTVNQQEILVSSLSDPAAPTYNLQLTTDNTYYARIQAKDNMNNLSAFSPEIKFLVDATAPVLADDAQTHDASDRAASNYKILITWPAATDTTAGLLGYIIYKNNTPLNLGSDGLTKDLSLDTASSLVSYLDTVSPDQNNTYSIKAIDLAGNESSSIRAEGIITVPETVAGEGELKISDVTAAPSDVIGKKTQATITWNTSVPATSQVEYGTSTDYTFKTDLDTGLNSFHTIILSDLNYSTIYHFKVASKDRSGKEVVSSDYTFTTKDPLKDENTLDTIITNLGGTALRVRDALSAVAAKAGEDIANPSLSVTSSTAAASLAGIAAAAAPVANAMTLFSLPEYVRALIFSLLSLGSRKKKKQWGKVVESGTDLPIAQAKINLLKVEQSFPGVEPSKKIAATTYTDKDGNFAFIADPGRYQLQIEKDMYHIIGSGSSYQSGQIITVKSEGESLIVPNIVMTLDEEQAKKKLILLHNIEVSERVLAYVSFGFLIFGMFTIASTLIRNPKDLPSLVLAVIYPILWYINLKVLRKTSPIGNVVDRSNYEGIPLALIRIMDKDGKRLIKTAITNEHGKFKALVDAGQYQIKVVKDGYTQKDSIDLDAREKLSAVQRRIELDKTGKPA